VTPIPELCDVRVKLRGEDVLGVIVAAAWWTESVVRLLVVRDDGALVVLSHNTVELLEREKEEGATE
jgi:hypothetical protein